MAFKDFMHTVKSEAGDAVEVTKIKTKISKERTNVKDNYQKIGEYVYVNLKDSMSDTPELAECFASIDASLAAIDDYNNQINKIKMNQQEDFANGLQ